MVFFPGNSVGAAKVSVGAVPVWYVRAALLAEKKPHGYSEITSGEDRIFELFALVLAIITVGICELAAGENASEQEDLVIADFETDDCDGWKIMATPSSSVTLVRFIAAGWGRFTFPRSETGQHVRHCRQR